MAKKGCAFHLLSPEGAPPNSDLFSMYQLRPKTNNEFIITVLNKLRLRAYARVCKAKYCFYPRS